MLTLEQRVHFFTTGWTGMEAEFCGRSFGGSPTTVLVAFLQVPTVRDRGRLQDPRVLKLISNLLSVVLPWIHRRSCSLT